MSDPVDWLSSVEAVGEYLTGVIPGFSGLRKIEKFKSGQSNPTYRLDAASGRYVLRAKPPGRLLASAHQVAREYRVMRALAGSAVPVPRMLHLDSDDGPLGRDFFVMEFVAGEIHWDPALPDFSNPQRAAAYDQMNQTLAALHAVDFESVGLNDFGRPGNYFARQLDRWARQYRASELEPIPEMDRLIGWLEQTLPQDDGQVALVHGDYRLDNMMFDANQRVVALLDWELSTLGHPIADLAYQCMQWRLPNRGDFRGLLGIDRSAQGIPAEEEYVARYCERRGLSTIDDWPFYLAFSFFRLAAILQGVVKRAVDGTASNPQQAKKFAAAIPVLAQLAGEVMV